MTAASAPDWPAPDFTLLDDDGCGDRPPWPGDVLPPFWRAWSETAARHASAPLESVGLALLTSAAGLIGGARRVALAPSWSEPCVLWTALVGGAACGKTAAMETSLRLVRALDRDLDAANAAAQRRHVTAQAVAHAEAWWWRDGVRGAVANHRAAREMPAAALEMEDFAPRRLVANDPAIGPMLTALRGNPRGVLLVRDPLTDWLDDHVRGADHRFWQGAWSGEAGTFTLRRPPAISLAGTAVSVLGAIRPEAMAAALDGDVDDVAARLLFAWPQGASFQLLPDVWPPADPTAAEALGRLRDLPGAVRVLPLATDARVAFDRFRHLHHGELAALEGLEAGWWSRGAGTVPRLAGVLTFLDWAVAQGPEPTEVPGWAMRAAATLWLDYLWPHARSVFRLAGGSVQERRARRVLCWLRQHGKIEASRTELRRNALGRTCNADETSRVAAALVIGGWLRPVAHVSLERGRPPVRWRVNDVLHRAGGA